MGGNALSVPGIRLLANDYATLDESIRFLISRVMPESRVVVIPSYFDKPDFGDIDVLVSVPEGATVDYRAIADVLFVRIEPYPENRQDEARKTVEIVRNGEVTSFGMPLVAGTFQVDLIESSEQSFDFALRYFAFNDLGNLLGRIAHKAGFKLGQYGLIYPLRDKTGNLIEEIMVTRDWSHALEFLGYDPVQYEQGFNGGFKKLTDIFWFALESRYCNRNIYLLENRNATSRVRDRKRPTYSKFLSWLESLPRNAMPEFDWSDKAQARMDFLGWAFDAFPDFSARYKDAVELKREKQLFSEKFNGEIVGQITGLSGKNLGLLITAIRRSFLTEAHFRRWVLASSDEEVRNMIEKSKGVFSNAPTIPTVPTILTIRRSND